MRRQTSTTANEPKNRRTGAVASAAAAGSFIKTKSFWTLKATLAFALMTTSKGLLVEGTHAYTAVAREITRLKEARTTKTTQGSSSFPWTKPRFQVYFHTFIPFIPKQNSCPSLTLPRNKEDTPGKRNEYYFEQSLGQLWIITCSLVTQWTVTTKFVTERTTPTS